MTKQERIYLDYNAGAPLLDCARDAVVEALSIAGNASSIHFEGRRARKMVEQARESVAKLAGANPENVFFTSGATEAANHLLQKTFRNGRSSIHFDRLFVSSVEHPCVMAGGEFAPDEIESIPVTEGGVVRLDVLESMCERTSEDGLNILVAVMAANNETGVVQPVAEISRIVHKYSQKLVVDASQALGKIPFSMENSGADFAFASSHKAGGPQGCGAVILRDKWLHPEPLIKGGGQEKRYRAGTENVAAIAGFGAACDWHLENLTKNVIISSLRDSIEERLGTISLEAGNKFPAPVFFGKQENRLPNTSCFSVAGINAETALVALDLAGISVSTGSACSSGRVEKSHVLDAMGTGEDLAAGALRLSLGWQPDEEGMNRFIVAWKDIIGRLAGT